MSYDDLAKKRVRDADGKFPKLGNGYCECPVCKGKGEYPYTTTMMMHCRQCNGYGWVKEGTLDATCIHKMKLFCNLGNCYNRYKCELCGQTEDVDSSD